MKNNRLDNLALLEVLDPKGMLTTIQRLHEQAEQAVAIGRQAEIPFADAVIRQVLFAGVGGSAIGGDLLRTYLGDKSKVPMMTHRDYRLPRFVSEETLVFISSNSGDTEEQLGIYDQAREIGAKIAVVSGGGLLVEKAVADGQLVLKYEGRTPLAPTARASIGFLFFPILITMQRLGLIDSVDQEIEDAIHMLRDCTERYAPQVSLSDNLAKQVASQLHERLPIIWGTTGTTEAVATRWKGQFNENTKCSAYANSFPELNHNEIVGFEAPHDVVKNMQVVILRSSFDHPQVQKRQEITQDILHGMVGGVTEVTATGETQLGQMFSLLALGDHVSVYLAALYGHDPSPITYIRYLKKKH